MVAGDFPVTKFESRVDPIVDFFPRGREGVPGLPVHPTRTVIRMDIAKLHAKVLSPLTKHLPHRSSLAASEIGKHLSENWTSWS